MKRIDQIGQNGNEGEHYSDIEPTQYVPDEADSSFGLPEHLHGLGVDTPRATLDSGDTPEVNTDGYLAALVNEHWAYIRNTLRVHMVHEHEIEIAEQHYKTAFRHGWKHRGEYDADVL